MAKIASSKSVPKGMQATYEAITTLTDAFESIQNRGVLMELG
jgi:hypothetical protein